MIVHMKGKVVGVDPMPEKKDQESAFRVSVLTQSGKYADIGQVMVKKTAPKVDSMIEGLVQVTGFYFGKAQGRFLEAVPVKL